MPSKPETTDLSLLKHADTILMANDEVDAGIALNAAVAELLYLRELVASGNPTCPRCKTKMLFMEYKGFYDSFTHWDCDCESLPGQITWKGEYA